MRGILEVINYKWCRYRKKEKLRKQLNMTRRCSRELDKIFELIDIDVSEIKLPPITVEVSDEANL